MDEPENNGGEQPSAQDSKKAQDAKNAKNNANVINNAADVAMQTKHPYAMAAGGAIKAADKLTGGKSSQALGQALNQANKKAPGGKMMQKGLNKASESGAADAVGSAARMKGGAGGGASAAAGGAATGASKATSAASNGPGGSGGSSGGGGLPKLGLGGGSGSSSGGPGGGGPGGSGGGSSAMETIEKAKKVAKVMKFLGPIIPYVLYAIAILLIVVAIMAEVMTVRDQVVGAIEGFMEGSQRLTNFLSGKGWNTTEETFYKTLKQAFEDFKGTDDQRLDIPLIASTIHYSKTLDLNSFDGEEGAHEEDVGSGDTYDSDSIWGAIVTTNQTRAFYNVANDKLGVYRKKIIPIGRKGLLGHLINTGITIEKCSSSTEDGKCTLGKAWDLWYDFFANIVDFQSTGYNEIETINGEDASVFRNFLDMFSDYFLGHLVDFIFSPSETVQKAIDYATQGQSLVSWRFTNFCYEWKEFAQHLTGDYNDQRLMDSPMSYYNKLVGTGTNASDPEFENIGLTGSLWDRVKKSFEGFNLLEAVGSILKGDFYVPVYHKVLDYKGYYRYLVNVYIPETYYHGQKLDEDYSFDNLIVAANEIFDQKYYYNYLVDDLIDDSNLTQCGVNFDGGDSEKLSLSITPEMVKNLYVNVYEWAPNFGWGSAIEETVSFKDYVIGVTYREVGATVHDNEEYLKAFMMAVKSFSLGRHQEMGSKWGITENDGKYYINMRNSTGDQVYCSLTKGCLNDKSGSNLKAAPSSELVSFLGRLYDEIENYYLLRESNKRFVGAYLDSLENCIKYSTQGECMGQRQAKEMGESGSNWKSIVGYFYSSGIGLVDITTGDFKVGVTQCVSPGLELGEDGYYIRTSAPTQSDLYFSSQYLGTSNIGQCVWYMKGRAFEIINNSPASQDKKDTANNKLAASHGNGSDWYTNGMCDTFACSNDYTKPKPGSIGVYKWSASNPNTSKYSTNYGHVIIIEKVSGDTVYYSNGWNSCGGASGNSSWSCVGFQYTSKSISGMKNLGGKYEFIGYVYLLG